MKLNIYRKLLLSYLAMALLTVLASAYAVIRLHEINDLARRIISEDVAVVDTAKGLLDALLAQESAEKRYLILKDQVLEDLFWQHSREFGRGLSSLAARGPERVRGEVARLGMLHGRYDELFQAEVTLAGRGQNQEAQLLSETQVKALVDDMAGIVAGLQKGAKASMDARMNAIDVMGRRASRLTLLLGVGSLAVGLLLVFLITYNISRPLRRLEKATNRIAEGRFDEEFHLDRDDEIGSLARAFAVMTRRLKELEEMNLDASPLTGHPGNRAIEREIKRRLASGEPFSLCQVDLDNFKPFADRYGYAWGSEVIKEVGRLLAEEVEAAGKEGIFLGHVGGDDFVLIAPPQDARLIAGRVVSAFGERIRRFYTAEDRQRGYFIGRDRQGREQRFPLITVTIAIVTDDGTRFGSPLEMAEAAAGLKEYAKGLPGSNYVTEEEYTPR